MRVHYLFAALIVAMSPMLEASQGPPEDSPEILQRDKLIEQVLLINPSVVEAGAAIRAARARVEVAGSLDDPRVTTSVAPLTLDDPSIGASISVSQEVPWPGRLDAREDQARSAVAMQSAELERVRLKLALNASVLYDRWYVIHRALELNEHHHRLVEQMKSSAESQYVVGNAAQQDPLQAEVRITRLLRERTELQADLRVTRAAINALLHRAPATPLAPPVALLEPPVPFAADSEVIGDQPELLRKQALISEAEAGLRLAELEKRPDLMAMTELSSMFMGDHRFMVGVGFRLPVRRSRIDASIRAARAELEARQAAMEGAKDEVAFEIQEAGYELESHLETLTLYQNLLIPASQDQTEAAQAGFSTGRNSFLAVLDAENNLQEVLLGYHKTLSAAWSAAARLSAASGDMPFTNSELDNE